MAFLLCDSVITDGQSRKKFIQGVFDQVHVASLPAVHPSMAAYFRLAVTPPAQTTAVQLNVRSPDGVEQELQALSVNAGPENVEGSIDIRGFPISQAGSYVFQLRSEGELLGEFKMRVIPPPGVKASDRVH